MKIIVGIGNPGREYKDTRHNIGFIALDRLAEKFKTSFNKKNKFLSMFSEIKIGDINVLLMKPVTYVNRTGIALSKVVSFYNLNFQDILVICDDMSLPAGKIRIRRSGSSGGHKGLNSIIESMGTTNFNRLRIGIGGHPPEMDTVDFVLSRFSRKEIDIINKSVTNAVDAAVFWVDEGIEACMNKFNG